MILLLFACTGDGLKDTSTPINNSNPSIIMATVAMDYSVGALAQFDLTTETIIENIASISGDPVVVSDGGWIWQINRYQYDTLRKYEPSNLQVPLSEVSLAPEVGSSNPHDVAICSDQLFVSLYGKDYMPILNIDTLAEVGQIELSSWADDDGIPEASSMVVVDSQLYVGLQRLDRNDSFEPQTSVILQIDCGSQSVVTSWEMGSNVQVIEWADTVAVVSQNTDNADAGAFIWNGAEWEQVWSTANNISSITLRDGHILYTSYSERYQLHCVDLSAGTEQSSEPWSEFLTDVLIDESNAGWVSAHWGWMDISNSEPGLYKVNLETCSVSNHWSMELPPYSLAETN